MERGEGVEKEGKQEGDGEKVGSFIFTVDARSGV